MSKIERYVGSHAESALLKNLHYLEGKANLFKNSMFLLSDSNI